MFQVGSLEKIQGTSLMRSITGSCSHWISDEPLSSKDVIRCPTVDVSFGALDIKVEDAVRTSR